MNRDTHSVTFSSFEALLPSSPLPMCKTGGHKIAPLKPSTLGLPRGPQYPCIWDYVTHIISYSRPRIIPLSLFGVLYTPVWDALYNTTVWPGFTRPVGYPRGVAEFWVVIHFLF